MKTRSFAIGGGRLIAAAVAGLLSGLSIGCERVPADVDVVAIATYLPLAVVVPKGEDQARSELLPKGGLSPGFPAPQIPAALRVPSS